MSRKDLKGSKPGSEKHGASRREFLKVAGAGTLTLSLGVLSCKEEEVEPTPVDLPPSTFPKPTGSYKFRG